jgi:hypothetical protein
MYLIPIFVDDPPLASLNALLKIALLPELISERIKFLIKPTQPVLLEVLLSLEVVAIGVDVGRLGLGILRDK